MASSDDLRAKAKQPYDQAQSMDDAKAGCSVDLALRLNILAAFAALMFVGAILVGAF